MTKRKNPGRPAPSISSERKRHPSAITNLPRDRVPALEELLGQRLNTLSPEARKRLQEAAAALQRVLEEVLPRDAEFETYEQTVLEISNEIARKELERKLQTAADAFAPVLRIDHNNDWHGEREGTVFEFRRHLRGTVTYHSLVGGLCVGRYTYAERNQGIRSMYVPLELAAGISERMTPCLAKTLAYGYAQMPSRELTTLLRYAGRPTPSRSTMERSADDLGTYARHMAPILMPELRAQELVPADAVALVLGLDRTSVAVRNDDPGRVQFFEHDLRRPRPHAWHPPDPRPGTSYHMDYVATITYVDAKGEKLLGREYRAPSSADVNRLTSELMADVKRALAQKPMLKISVVQDGAPELWKAMRRGLRTLGVSAWHEVLDWFHTSERLAACALLVSHDERQQLPLRAKWEHLLLEHADGGARCLRALRATSRRIQTEAARVAMREHLSYFRKRRAQLAYCTMRNRHLPIGSGATEGACKTLIGTRAKRGGQHWKQRGLSAVLHLRALVNSNRFETYWSRFTARYRATSMTPVLARA